MGSILGDRTVPGRESPENDWYMGCSCSGGGLSPAFSESTAMAVSAPGSSIAVRGSISGTTCGCMMEFDVVASIGGDGTVGIDESRFG